MQVTDDVYRQVSRVSSAAARRLGRVTADEAEDLTQTVLLKLWICRARIRSLESLPALAYRAATNIWLNSCRSRSNYAARLARYREIVSRTCDATTETFEKDEAEAVAHYLAELDPRTADAVRRHCCDDQSYATIGRALCISKGAAHKLVQRGLAQLKAKLIGGKLADARGPRTPSPQGPQRRRKNFSRRKLAITSQSAIEAAIAATPAAQSNKERGQPCPT